MTLCNKTTVSNNNINNIKCNHIDTELNVVGLRVVQQIAVV